jgi:hypothetical protein
MEEVSNTSIQLNTSMYKSKLDIDKEDGSTKDIKDYELFIDEQIQKIKLEELKSEILKFTLDKVMERVRQELNIVYNSQDRRNKKVHSELCEKNEIIELMKQEIDFLRKESMEKTEIIADITKKYISHNNSFSLTKIHDVENSQKNLEINLEDSIGNTKLDDIETHKTIGGKVDEQLKEIRIKHNKHFKDRKQREASQLQASLNKKELANDTTFVIGDSMLNGIDEKKIGRNVKVRYFPGATIEDMYNYAAPILKKQPKNIIVHIGTNNAKTETSNEIIDKLLSLKHHIEKESPHSNVIISSMINRIDDAKASLTARQFNKHLKQLKIDSMDNDNITADDLGKRGLHLSQVGKKKFTTNLLKKLSSSKKH